MKVFIVTYSYEYNIGFSILGVFDSIEKAQAFVDSEMQKNKSIEWTKEKDKLIWKGYGELMYEPVLCIEKPQEVK